jgi:hypothetical protein
LLDKQKALQKNLQGPSISFYGQKVKGEEKPEEELMGKRKSSPRLATTSDTMLLILLSPSKAFLYIKSGIYLNKV